jgi:hypothetical protein
MSRASASPSPNKAIANTRTSCLLNQTPELATGFEPLIAIGNGDPCEWCDPGAGGSPQPGPAAGPAAIPATVAGIHRPYPTPTPEAHMPATRPATAYFFEGHPLVQDADARRLEAFVAACPALPALAAG